MKIQSRKKGPQFRQMKKFITFAQNFIKIIFFVSSFALVSEAHLKLLLSFAVGGLLGDVFLHLLPEAWMYSKFYFKKLFIFIHLKGRKFGWVENLAEEESFGEENFVVYAEICKIIPVEL